MSLLKFKGTWAHLCKLYMKNCIAMLGDFNSHVM